MQQGNPISIMLEHGGLAIWLIILSGVFLIIFGLERFITLFVRLAFKTDSAIDTIKGHILDHRYTDAIQICNSKIEAPVLSVIKSSLLAAESGREAMRSALGGALLEVSHRCEKRLQYLSLIANVATLLGLFGTITGLIKTFAAIANADASEKAKMLGIGISEAMYATASGLIIGIAAMVIHTVCTAKADNIVGHAQDIGFKVITWVEQAERARGAGGRSA